MNRPFRARKNSFQVTPLAGASISGLIDDSVRLNMEGRSASRIVTRASPCLLAGSRHPVRSAGRVEADPVPLAVLDDRDEPRLPDVGLGQHHGALGGGYPAEDRVQL